MVLHGHGFISQQQILLVFFLLVEVCVNYEWKLLLELHRLKQSLVILWMVEVTLIHLLLVWDWHLLGPLRRVLVLQLLDGVKLFGGTI